MRKYLQTLWHVLSCGGVARASEGKAGMNERGIQHKVHERKALKSTKNGPTGSLYSALFSLCAVWTLPPGRPSAPTKRMMARLSRSTAKEFRHAPHPPPARLPPPRRGRFAAIIPARRRWSPAPPCPAMPRASASSPTNSPADYKAEQIRRERRPHYRR